ncbi:hyaluronan mediated motility receptor isoform X1 [Rhagoletis pomonella]|uniref:hyaluronan mediated motility receptor isoform X1 n=1 Tax=Rhagoletis pomonella TaxID=28610 RepID=UPI0017840A0B|nr:hyaluronan mediated motility receptor isoform X1 [Rhagoletis pomonella]
MDVSPSRNSAGSDGKLVSNSLPPGRKDLSKSIPKLTGELIFKQKNESTKPPPATEVIAVEGSANVTSSSNTITLEPTPVPTLTSATESKPHLARSKTLASAQNTVYTKIPMKRATGTSATTKTVITPRYNQRQQMRSASKISLTIKELGGGGTKVDSNVSKLSFKANTSTNLKPPSHLKAQTTRGNVGARISKRSGRSMTHSIQPKYVCSQFLLYPPLLGSTISCHSNSEIRKGDEPLQQLTKISSSAGDHESSGSGQILSARERVAENNKLKVFEGLQRKLQDMQTDFMLKFETLKLTSPDKLKADYKFITMVKNDEYKLLLKEDHMLKMPKKLPADSVNDFKEKVRAAVNGCLMCLMDNLKELQSAKGEGAERTLNLEETHNKLENDQCKKLHDLFECVNSLANARDTEMDAQIVRMQKEIQEGRKALQLSEKRLAEIKAVHTEELEALQKELKEKTDADVAKRETQIAELNRKLRSLEKQHDKLKTTLQQNTEECTHEHTEKAKLLDELKSCKESIQALNKKLTHAESQLNHEKKDKHDKNEIIQKLEVDLDKAKREIEEALQAKPQPEQPHHEKELKKEIHKLKGKIETLEKEKQEFVEQELMLQEKVTAMDKLRNKIAELEERNRELLEREKIAEENTELPKENKAEVSSTHIPTKFDINCVLLNIQLQRLLQSEAEKHREIDKLKTELTKALFNMEQLEEQIRRDQQLLEVRSELINSLQTNDNSQRIHLEQMFVEVGEKNSTINELNNELRTKSEEFHNLFSTLSNKQMELSRQEHMIKLLEESNERSQMLRVKQEEKIGRMEEEIAHLKQTIAIYQHNVLGNAGCKNLIYQPIAGSDDYNENLYYYTSERRRKRQVDINVKKYET